MQERKTFEKFPGDLSRFTEFREAGLITPAGMRIIDANAQDLGVDGMQLMESAGAALAGMARTYHASRILVLCGAGNNGGDGMVAARHLQHDADVTVLWYDSGRMTDQTRSQLRALRNCRVRNVRFRCRDEILARADIFVSADLIIDSLLGTGGEGEVREPLRSCVILATKAEKPIIAADIPTPGIIPDKICAFHRAKTADSQVFEIGVPLLAEICTGSGDLLLIPERIQSAHKGAGGEVLVVGGGPYQGAPWMSGMAALRAGADIVRIASPGYIPEPDLIHVPLGKTRLSESDLDLLVPLCEQADVVLCGPGLGTGSHEVVTALAPHARKAVFDADALRDPLPGAGETLYTPHAGEFSRMTGSHPGTSVYDRACAVRSADIRGTVLLKGEVDIIGDRRRIRFNRTGTAAMTTGGTGDVLAGVCSALMVSLPPFEAACIGAYATGKAGEMVTSSLGYGLTAQDLLPAISQVLFRCNGTGE
ncbi:MAG: NAD(P)H-hydrate dehydratase [Methanospirillum sp.]|nr:NAD(P)H-hydrate dehydratase [Methanospirillum sp.]